MLNLEQLIAGEKIVNYCGGCCEHSPQLFIKKEPNISDINIGDVFFYKCTNRYCPHPIRRYELTPKGYEEYARIRDKAKIKDAKDSR